MIRRVRGEMVCECDGCGEEVFGGTEEFDQFWLRLRSEGWRARKDRESGEWSHQCPDCARESR